MEGRSLATFRIDPASRHQTLDNFGASLCWWVDPVFKSLPREDMERVARLLFDRETGAGLSCVRFNIGAGSVWYDADRIPAPTRRSECFQHGPDAPFDASMHEGQQWMLRRARELGVECAIAFTNSPPAWLTANGHTSDDATTGTTNLRFGQEAAFLNSPSL